MTIPPALPTSTHQAPAKINLFLAVTGRRPDGFHEIISVAAPLLWGDSLNVEETGSSLSLECDDPAIPRDASNLVLKAAEVFREAAGWKGGAHFRLTKRIPSGAGLGGASSDAVCALVALNRSAGSPLDAEALALAAARVGSDCPLFLAGSPVIMRGRGEVLSPLPKEAYRRIRGSRVLLFKPDFPISTPWAYGMLAGEAPRGYVSARLSEAKLSAWIAHPSAPVEDLLFNSMERPAFAKYPAIPALLEDLHRRFGLVSRMSGSGSACYAFLKESADSRPVEAAIRESWGASAFVHETRIA